MLGYLMEKAVQAVDNILKDIKRPFTAIMGGSKAVSYTHLGLAPAGDTC